MAPGFLVSESHFSKRKSVFAKKVVTFIDRAWRKTGIKISSSSLISSGMAHHG